MTSALAGDIPTPYLPQMPPCPGGALAQAAAKLARHLFPQRPKLAAQIPHVRRLVPRIRGFFWPRNQIGEEGRPPELPRRQTFAVQRVVVLAKAVPLDELEARAEEPLGLALVSEPAQRRSQEPDGVDPSRAAPAPEQVPAGPEARLLHLGVRYLVVNRPGFGGSDPSPGRSVVAFAHDLEEVMGRLSYERFCVVGVSAGAPYALACGWALAERVTGVAAVSPLAPALGLGAAPSLRYQVPLAAFGSPRLGPTLASLCLRGLRLRDETTPEAMIDDYVVCTTSLGL